MAQPIWITPAGSLGSIPEGVFYQQAMLADTPVVATTTCTATDSTTDRITCASTANIYPGLNVMFGGTNGEVFGGINALTRYFVLAVYNSTQFSITASEFTTAPISLTTASGSMAAEFKQHVHFNLQAGQLPSGIQVADNGLIVGTPQAVANIQGVPTPVAYDVTSKFTVRAYTMKYVGLALVVDQIRDRTFTLTVTGPTPPEFITPAGQIEECYDGTLFSYQIEYTDADPGAVVVVRLVGGSLPTGLSISSTGLISGIVEPLNINDSFADYEFTLELSDGVYSQLRTFSIYVYNKIKITADDTYITSDDTFITADITPVRPPIIINPEGTIGTVNSDNWFAYQFIGMVFDSDQVEFQLFSAPPGLTIDQNSGWMTGFIPPLGIVEDTYDFSVRISKVLDPTIFNQYDYSLTITGPLSSGVVWLTPSNLGTIDNGATSTLYVAAESIAGVSLQYRLLSGSNSNLPQGLELLPSGDIAGRVSFNTFAVDSGTTTFDLTLNDLGITTIDTETTFDMKHTFTVQAFSVANLVNVAKTFYITVVRKYNEPYENLYIEAMPPLNDRAVIQELLQNSDIFQPDFLYRPTDPNFGRADKVVYNHAFGLTAATYADYVSSLYENHYWKDLTLGEIKVAQARDHNDQVIYEVVYSQVIDNLVNAQGQSVSKQVILPYPINSGDSTEIDLVYPNSLVNMRDQVIDTVGQVSNVLPLWMTSKQANGRVLGFTPAWVLAYTKPNKGDQVAYYIRTKFGERLNIIDFEVDRYELDGLLTKNWDPETESWEPAPAETTFDLDQTVFDGHSMRFIAPVDMYSNTQAYDKYLVFPHRNIVDVVYD